MGENYWTCKIGPAPRQIPEGADLPMRRAVEAAFHELFGKDYEICFSGWGGKLTKTEQEVLNGDRIRRRIRRAATDDQGGEDV